MVLREMAGVTVTVAIVVYMLWFVIPITKTSYNTEMSQLNQSSPQLQQIKPFTDNWWIIFPLLIAVAGGYTIWQYATNRNALDY